MACPPFPGLGVEDQPWRGAIVAQSSGDATGIEGGTERSRGCRRPGHAALALNPQVRNGPCGNIRANLGFAAPVFDPCSFALTNGSA
jgi:hypothetical protein